MIPSIILNYAIVAINIGCLAWGLTHAKPPSALFRYFTTLSNMVCAFAALIVVIMYALGPLPFWTVLVKYAATCAVTVTMLTVVFFLLPVFRNWKELFGGISLFMHLICPLLALISFLCFEKTDMPAWVIAVGVAPVLLYAALYCRKVLYSPPKCRWDDFYGFNRSGKWQLSFAFMTIGAGLVALALWAI